MKLFIIIGFVSCCWYYSLAESYVAKPSVLVTGGAGFVGSHIALFLSQKGYEVVILDRKIKQRYSWANYIEADYDDEHALEDIFRQYQIEGVFHCAALAIVPNSFSYALEFYECNIAKLIKLLKIMRSHKVNRFIFASSRSIYGNAHYLPMNENHPKNPLSPYARTKLFAEYILEDLHKAYGLEYVSLRFINVVGAMPEYGLGEDHDPETHVFPLLIHAAKYNLPFIIFGTDHETKDGTCVRSYIHVNDVANANYLAFEYLKNGGKPDVFQLGSELVLSIKAMISAVETFYNTSVNTIVLPKRFADSPELTTDYSKIRRVLGWEPKSSTLDNVLASMDAFEESKLKSKNEDVWSYSKNMGIFFQDY